MRSDFAINVIMYRRFVEPFLAVLFFLLVLPVLIYWLIEERIKK